jgi:HD-GYP domain-containing protein (c-di-GMP phosphodiesterase class II)
VERGLEKHASTSAVLADMCEGLDSKHAVSTARLRSLIDEFTGMLTIDCDLLTTIVAMQRSLGEYLFDHCVNTSLISMVIGAQLGLNREQLLELGLGTIFHDAGMLRVPEEIRLAPRGLTPPEWAEIRRHPTYTLEYSERIRGLSSAARYVGYQVHERIDGTGYPSQISALAIHPYARAVAVADTYTAMTRPRPHRAAIPSHEAVKQILVAGSRDQLDRESVRALLDSVSAFPIGSLVELNTGLVGRVIRANPGAHTRPVIVEVSSASEPSDVPIDLSKELDLDVTHVLSQTAATL